MQSNNIYLLDYILVQYSISGMKCTCKNPNIIVKENGKCLSQPCYYQSFTFYIVVCFALLFFFLFGFEQAFSCMIYE